MKKFSLLAGVSALALIVGGCDSAPENVATENTTIVAENETVNEVAANEVANDDETPVDVNSL